MKVFKGFKMKHLSAFFEFFTAGSIFSFLFLLAVGFTSVPARAQTLKQAPEQAPAQMLEKGFTSLFNGQDLTGWTPRGGSAAYSVENGVIVGRCAPGTPGNTFLCTEKEYGNFILKLEFRFVVNGNSGVQFRSHARQNGNSERVYGYQCEIADRVAIGQIYDEGRRAWGYSSKFRDLRNPNDWFSADAVRPYRAKEWNSVEIQCIGPSIRTWINGISCADIMDVLDADGFIGLQVHAGGAGTLEWRNLRIQELPASEWKPLEKEPFSENDAALRTVCAKKNAENLLSDAGKAFLKDGENSVCVTAVGNRWVEIVNEKEVLDTTDAAVVSERREQVRSVSVQENVKWESMEITQEMRKMMERK